MQANMAKARAAIEANVLKDQLRAYEYGDTTDAATCFLCGTAISDDEAAVTTALGPIHQTCHEEYGQD